MATPGLTPLKQRDIKSCLVYGGNLNAAGLVVWSTPIDLCLFNGVNVYESFDLSLTAEMADFTPSDNFVTTRNTEKVGFTASLSDIVQSYTYSSGFAAGYPSVVEAIMVQFTHVQVRATFQAIGTSATPFGRACLGVVNPGQTGGISSQSGKKISTLTIEPWGYMPILGTATIPSSWN